MSTPQLSPDDREALKACLRTWKDQGVFNPLIPLDYDADGDGQPDAWGLDAFGELILVTAVPLSLTVYESTGDGIEGGGSE